MGTLPDIVVCVWLVGGSVVDSVVAAVATLAPQIMAAIIYSEYSDILTRIFCIAYLQFLLVFRLQR